MDLKGKIAIVTGASSGLGEAFSSKLIEKGATVYGLARRLNRLEELQTKLGESFIPVQMDITQPRDIETWARNQFTGNHLPHILINNAGLGYFADIDALSIEKWSAMMDVNLNGVFYLTREVVPLMKRSGAPSHIINIASIAGLIGNPQISGYNATKFGLRGFSEALFKELRYKGIKVTTMFPGSIETDFFDNTSDITTHSNMLQASDVADTLIFLLETPDNHLINEITLRPLNPQSPDQNQ